ncbi:ferritin-like domain-containing protein [Candidatus Avelusimicrobium fimicolum]|uniref:ferritin-like domain-containing protein n=1 Tax=Candidatus Avelusimicrobium fimicolum TaxID=3416216 RepID=UPI003D0E74F2
MGMKGREIVQRAGLDVQALVTALNKAYCDEWLAYYQYWVGAQVATGVLAPKLIEEMEEHAAEELDHAKKLSKRIIELGGTPALSPQDWYKESTCGYLVPKDSESKILLAQNLQGERCAIEVYNKLLDMVKGKDPITFHLLREILEDEVEHEQDLEDIGLDIKDTTGNDCGCCAG